MEDILFGVICWWFVLLMLLVLAEFSCLKFLERFGRREHERVDDSGHGERTTNNGTNL